MQIFLTLINQQIKQLRMLQKFSCNKINENIFDLIGKQWMLITFGKKDEFNTMTASWGQLGYLWNSKVSTIFIRPQRHTFGFAEKFDEYTLSLFEIDIP